MASRTTTTTTTLAVVLLSLLSAGSEAFSSTTGIARQSLTANGLGNEKVGELSPNLWLSPSSSARGNCMVLRAAAGSEDEDDDDDDDEDDDEIDDAALGDWRKFRASLIDGGLPSEEGTSATDGEGSGSKEEQSSNKKKSRPVVAQENEKLLAEQNEELAKEYRAEVWAHTVGQPEVGGLLCRMPLEAEIYFAKGGYWKQKLDVMLASEDPPITGTTTDKTKLDEDVEDQLTVVQVDHWFKVAEKMVTNELESISKSGKVQNGILNPNDLGDNERILLDKYLGYKSTWQEICLLLSHNPESGCSESVILNRPITKSINKQLAVMLLEGSSGSGKGSFSYDFVDQVVLAFGKEAAVYMGGPHLQDEPALLIHGISSLRGAREVAPGTGIYQGGWEAAVEGILKGQYKPLDFRFFLGRQSYDPKEYPERGALIQKIQDGAYQPLACARSLALKQCLGLPKPLWHEVLELCGGELKALSTIELRKRVDLQQ